MNFTHHSEFLPLHSILIKTVEKAFVSQNILDLQWEELNYLSSPDYRASLSEYESFQTSIESAAAEVYVFPEKDELTIDSIYCRDASIATDYGMILCRMGKGGRINEPEAQREYFQQLGIPVLGEIVYPGTLEGGDVAWIDEKTLAVGHTYRTNEEGIVQLRSLLEPKGIEIIVAELPHYKGKEDVFHLMSILSPVDHNLAVVYSPLMPISFRNELLSRGFEFVEVPEQEFESMGCNVLALSPRNCLMVGGNPIVEQRLRDAGCQVQTYKGAHISVLGGGGPTCLTRPLKRKY